MVNSFNTKLILQCTASVFGCRYVCLYYICMCICLCVMTVFDICLYNVHPWVSILLASYACTLSVYAFKQEIFLLFLFSLSLRHQFLLYTYRSSRHYFSVKLCDRLGKSILKNKHWIAYVRILSIQFEQMQNKSELSHTCDVVFSSIHEINTMESHLTKIFVSLWTVNNR